MQKKIPFDEMKKKILNLNHHYHNKVITEINKFNNDKNMQRNIVPEKKLEINSEGRYGSQF